MATGENNPLSQHLRRFVALAKAQDVSDSELMESFVADRDDTAFAALFRRHGPMVLGLCRRVLRNDHDAEDAFQATFMVFARKARFLRSRELIGGWLYGVAYRTAQKARCAAARRRVREAAMAARTAADPLTEMTVSEAQGIVDEELARLAEKFRAPLVLCCLEGLTRDEAAQQLGWTLGVLKSRLEQARELLRGRLIRRGVTLSVAMLSLGMFGTIAQAAVPAALAGTTLKAAALFAAGAVATSMVSSQVVSLAEGVVRAMLFAKLKVALVVLLVLAVVGGGVFGVVQLRAGAGPEVPAPEAIRAQAPAPKPDAPAKERVELKPESLERWGRSEVLVTAKLVRATGGPVGLSNPPLYNHSLQFQVVKVLRGAVKKGDDITGTHSARQKVEPVFPQGKECLVALNSSNSSRGRWVVQSVQELQPQELAQAELACAVPIGWSMEKGRLLSPWARLGAKAWPAEAKGKGPFVCAATGRPALLAGDGIEFMVEPVPPPVVLKYGNPDGDGFYLIKVKNVTGKPITIPALLTDGKTPLWDESMVILCQSKVYPIPGAKGVAKTAQPTVLKPGESVSGVVNALKLQGPEWPRGGYRIEFQFCLGEKSVTKSFYYTSKHHDPLREKANAEK